MKYLPVTNWGRVAFVAALFSPCLSLCQAGVFAHYSFDNNYQDSSGYGRHGSLTDVGSAGNSGIIQSAGNYKFGGGAMDFSDDRDYVAIPSQTFSSGTPYTIAFWAQKDTASRSWNMVIGERDNTQFFIASRGSADNELRWRSANTNTERQHDFAVTSDTAWHHYAIVAEGTTVKLYLDGALVSTGTGKQTGMIIDTIGAAYTDGDLDFQGRIDEMWILDEAADATMVNDLYTSNDPGITGGPPPTNPSVTKVRVMLLGGQSNADGRASVSELPTSPINLQNPQDDVDFLYKVQGGSLTMTTLRPGLSETSGFGPAITLGRSLADLYAGDPNTRVAIIKYANGGTNLYSHWKGGGDNTTTGDGSEYVTFQQTVTAGLAQLALVYPNASIELKGMAWMQGESDANSTGASAYQTNLTGFITDIRATYGADLPFIIGRLSSGQTSINVTYLAQIRAAQDAVEAADPRTGLIDMDSFGMKTDNLHFNGAGQQSMGTAFAREVAYYDWMLDNFTTAEINAGDAEPDADADGDGKTNHTEFIGDSAPKDATSLFKAWITLPTPSTVEIHYNSSAFRRYAVEQYQIATGTWVEILPYELGDGSVKNRGLTLVSYPQIFRVRSDLP